MTSTTRTAHSGGPPPGSTVEHAATSTSDRDATDKAADEAARLREEGRERAQDLAEDARQHVRGVTEVAVSQVRDRADEQVQRAGGGLREASNQMQALAAGRPDDAGPLGDYVESVANLLDGWAGRLERDGLQGLMGDVSDFARRKPGQFLAGAFAAGILAGRIGRNVQAADVEMPSSTDGGRSGGSSAAGSSQRSADADDAMATGDDDESSSQPSVRVTSEPRDRGDTSQRAGESGHESDRTEVIEVQSPASGQARQGTQS